MLADEHQVTPDMQFTFITFIDAWRSRSRCFYRCSLSRCYCYLPLLYHKHLLPVPV